MGCEMRYGGGRGRGTCTLVVKRGWMSEKEKEEVTMKEGCRVPSAVQRLLEEE